MVRLVRYLILFAIVLGTSPLLAQSLHKVYVDDGRIIIGEVTDKGNKVEITLWKGKVKGKVWILKRNIVRIEGVKKKKSKKPLLWLIIFTDGRRMEVDRVEKADHPGYVVALRKNNKVTFSKKDIEKIIKPSERKKEEAKRNTGVVPGSPLSKELREDIKKNIGLLKSKNLKEALQARNRILKFGIFAEPFLRKSAKKQSRKVAQMKEHRDLDPPYARSGLALYRLTISEPMVRLQRSLTIMREILGIHEVKKMVTPAMEEKVRNVYSRLASTSTKVRLGVLREIVLYTPKDCPPLLSYFVEKEEISPQVKAYCITQLGVLGEVKKLVKIYENSRGQLKFAAAMALGDNGVYLGMPTVIDALSIDNVKIRKIAIRKLKDWTDGVFFGYFADDPPERRKKAIAKWYKWYKKNASKIVGEGIEGLKKPKVTQNDIKEGLHNWRKAREDWQRATYEPKPKERSFLIDRAAIRFEKALKHYPNFVHARLNLAEILYKEKDEHKEAFRHLKKVVTHYRSEAGEMGQKLAYFHMGNIRLAQKNWDRAIFRYERALGLDPFFIDGYIALGYTYFQKATQSKEGAKKNRELFKQSLEAYKKALRAMKRFDRQLMKARLPRDPEWVLYRDEATKVSFGDYTKSSKVMRGLVYYQIARVYLALREYGLAVSKLKLALKWDPDNKKYKRAYEFWSKQ